MVGRMAHRARDGADLFPPREMPGRLKAGSFRPLWRDTWPRPRLLPLPGVTRFAPLSVAEPDTVNNPDGHQLILSANMFVYVRGGGF
jgi:hypothetical protein